MTKKDQPTNIAAADIAAKFGMNFWSNPEKIVIVSYHLVLELAVSCSPYLILFAKFDYLLRMLKPN